MSRKCNLIGIIGGMLVSFLFLFPFASFAQYCDINASFAKDAINRWSERKIIQGYDGKFRPDDYITRAELSVILNKILQYETEKEYTDKFTDLKSSFYTKDILSLNEQNIIIGENKKLRPDDKVTRQEAITILARSFDVQGLEKNIDFIDNNDISTWAKKSISIMKNKGFINGYKNKINPKQNIKRSELVQILDNMIDVYLGESGQYNEDILGTNINKIAIIQSNNLIIKNWNTSKDIIITANKNLNKIHFQNVKLSGKISFLKRKNKLKVNFEKSVVQNLDIKDKSINIHADKYSHIAQSEIKVNILKEDEKLSSKKVKDILNPGYSDEYRPKEPKNPITKSEDSSSNDDSSSSDEKKEIPKNPDNNTEKKSNEQKDDTKKEDNKTDKDNNKTPENDKKDIDDKEKEDDTKYDTKLKLLFENLESDGKIYINFTGKNIDIPDKFIILNIENGENTGKKIPVILRGKDLSKLKSGEKGEYKINIEALEDIVINETKYTKAKFIAVFVIK